jgi:hypothetical protein
MGVSIENVYVPGCMHSLRRGMRETDGRIMWLIILDDYYWTSKIGFSTIVMVSIESL